MCSGEADSHKMSSAVVETATAHTPSAEDLSIVTPVTDSSFQESHRSSSPLDVTNKMDSYHKSDLDSDHIENTMSPAKDSDYPTPRYLSPMNHVGLLNNNKGVSVETSKLLRGILQGKDKHGMTNGNGNISMDHSEDNQFMMNKIIQRDSPGIIRNGSFDTDLDSMRSATPGEFSSEELSDHEVSGVTQSEGAEGQDGEEGSPSEVPEVKKLRVESIISSMSRPNTLKPNDQPTERRHKRKQFTPQQHDANLEEPTPKIRRVEKDVLRKQLRLMQTQLTDMQQKYLELFDQADSSDTSDMELSEALSLKKFNGNVNPEERSFKSHSIASLTDLTPSHFIKQASRLVMDQEKANKEDCPDTADLDTLAKMLKREISSSVGSLVDNIVSQFIQKQKQMMEKPVGKENTMQPLPPKPARESPKPSSSPIINIMPREMEPEQNSQKEMPIIPKPTRTKVTDKLLPPVPDPRPRNFADLARHHAALFPPPPYFPSQLPPPMQPLFPKEPEQTEALALVVNTPKKKRTKVTDTRLSPRAAKALLQEGMHMPDAEREKHLRDIPPLLREMASHHPGLPPHFPHPGLHPGDFHNPLVPVTLPTPLPSPTPACSIQKSWPCTHPRQIITPQHSPMTADPSHNHPSSGTTAHQTWHTHPQKCPWTFSSLNLSFMLNTKASGKPMTVCKWYPFWKNSFCVYLCFDMNVLYFCLSF